MTTLSREQAEALARLGGYSPCQCEPNCTAYTDADGEACAFNPVEDAEQFDRILFAYVRQYGLNEIQHTFWPQNMRANKTLTDWRAAVLVAISDEVK